VAARAGRYDVKRRTGMERTVRKVPLLWLATTLWLGLLWPGATQAQDFPNRPITIVIGLAPGGVTDVNARLFADVVSRSVGQRVLVENRQGAGGALAAAAVQRAAPDGYTVLLFSGSQHATVPALQSAPYDPVKYAPVTLLFDLSTLLVVPAESPAKAAAELWEYGKKKTGGLLFGSPGVGTPSHLQAVLIAKATNTPMQYVHYRGGGAMAPDLVAGRVDFAMSSYAASGSQLEAGKLRALAIDADRRWSRMPDLATLSEVGLGAAKVATWFALAAPPGTPANIVQKLHAEFVKASRDPALAQRLSDNATPVHTGTPEDMGRLLAAEVESTNRLVRELGLKQ
jgi:tripartite-type tricarboxylate transporter receptor subunit TctC